MTLNQPLYAIVDSTGRILGDGECPALSASEPDAEEIALVERISGCTDTRVVKCRIVNEDVYIGLASALRMDHE